MKEENATNMITKGLSKMVNDKVIEELLNTMAKYMNHIDVMLGQINQKVDWIQCKLIEQDCYKAAEMIDNSKE